MLGLVTWYVWPPLDKEIDFSLYNVRYPCSISSHRYTGVEHFPNRLMVWSYREGEISNDLEIETSRVKTREFVSTLFLESWSQDYRGPVSPSNSTVFVDGGENNKLSQNNKRIISFLWQILFGTDDN